MKKGCRYLVSIISVILALSFLAACGKSDGIGITSDWKLQEYTINGKTTRPGDSPVWVRLAISPRNPKFICKDGKNCVFSINKEDHKGTITESDGIYTIDYQDTYKNMYGQIDGNQLILTNETGTVEIIFTTDQ